MNVLNLGTTSRGGSGKALGRFHENMPAHRLNSTVVVGDRASGQLGYHEISPSLAGRLSCNVRKMALRLRSDAKYYFQDQLSSLVSRSALLDPVGEVDPDVVVAHWLSIFLNVADNPLLLKHTTMRIIQTEF